MSPRDLATVVCAITGIVALFTAAPLLQALAAMPFFPEEIEGNIVVFAIVWSITPALVIFAGIGLVTRRRTIAQWIIPHSKPASQQDRVEQFQDLAFAVLGLYFVISTLPDLASLAGTLINLRAHENVDQFAGAFRNSVPFYLGTLLKLVVGSYLFFYAHSLAAFWRRRKAAPQPAQVDPATKACPACGMTFKPSDYRADLDERLCSKCHRHLPDNLFD